MFRQKCAIALSILLALSSISPTSGFAQTKADQKFTDLPAWENGEGKPREEGFSAEKQYGLEEDDFLEEEGNPEERDGLQEATNPEEASFLETKVIDGVAVTVTADAGVFPKDSFLRVKKINKKREKEKIEDAVSEKLEEENADLADSLIFDISILNSDGMEIQPDTEKGEVKVQFEKLNLSFMEAGKELAVYHMDELDAEAEKLEDLQLDQEKKSLELYAKHFSLFIISLIDKKEGTTESEAIEVGTKRNIGGLLRDHFGLKILESVEAKSLNEDILSLEKEGTEFFITAKKIGTGKIQVKAPDGSINYYEFIVQGEKRSGRIGKNIEYNITGEGKDMTLNIRGYGDTDFLSEAPWRAYSEYISTVNIEEGIENLYIQRAFLAMPNLTKVSLPSGLLYIPHRAFYGCNKLENLTIPASVKFIGHGAFVKTKGVQKNKIVNLSSFKLKSQEEIIKDQNHYNSNFTTVEQSTEANSDRIVSFQFEDLKLDFIPGKIAFFELQTLVSAKGMSYSYNDIEYYLYRTENSAEQVDENTFKKDGIWNSDYKMKGVKSIFSLDGLVGNKQRKREVQYANQYPLNQWEAGKNYTCYVLAVIHEQGNETHRKLSQPFSVGLANATNIQGNEGGISWSIEPLSGTEFEEPFMLRVGGSGRILDCNGENGDRPWVKLMKAMDYPATGLELQEGVSEIGQYSFESMAILGDLMIPSTVKKIGDFAFEVSKIQGNIQFSQHLEYIGNSAFDGFNYNGNLTLPEGLKEIGEYAFYGQDGEWVHEYYAGNPFNGISDSSYGTVIIPASVKRIGEAAFYKDSMGINGRNKIINNSSIKLSERYANPLYTEFVIDNSGEESIEKPKNNGSSHSSSSSASGGFSGGGGGGGSSGGGGGAPKASNAGGTTANSSSEKADWQKDGKGWWVRNADGSYPKDEWKKINNSWYFFNQEGYMSTGWVQIKGSWYYLDTTDTENGGKMNTGWKYIGEQWYYFGTEEGEMQGKMSTGWKYISGKWYYLNPEAGANNGKMLFNTVVDGYTLGPDGAWDNQPKKAI